LAVQRTLNEACEKLGVYHTEDFSLLTSLRINYSDLAATPDGAQSSS
jgi:hypothetical protein